MKESEERNIAFLFGAGISIPSKMPSTQFITDRIFSGERIVRGTAENYFMGDPKSFNWDPNQGFIPRIKSFLEILKTELQGYYEDSPRDINYEDIYYFLDFIRKNSYGSEKNPAFKYLIKNFEPTIKNLFSPIDPLINTDINFNELLKESILYIKGIVFHLLAKLPEGFNGFKFLTDLLYDSHFSTIDIFSLNHDIVLETFFKSIKQDFCEGFGNTENGYRFWDHTLFALNNRINLYKLHGSVDWFYYDESSWEDRRVCKCSSEILWRDPREPIVLIGTYNKLSEYIKTIYLELFFTFHKKLNDHSRLIVSGYSFTDKGINDKIFDWLLSNNNKMIIIDPHVEYLKEKMPTILYRKWDNNDLIIPINQYIENVTWDDIRSRLP